MALGPETIRKNDEATVKAIEALIDQAIQRATPGTTTVYVTPPNGFTYALLPAIKDLYQKAGWYDVEYFSDQRDGNSLILHAAPRRV